MAPSRKLIAVVGTAAAVTLSTYVPQFEGMILRGYRDPIGIVTACAGHTATAVLGKPYTREECERLLNDDLAMHAAGVLQCSPILGRPENVHERAAVVSFAFNVGTAAYCKSTMARKFNAGDMAGGCAEFPKWIYAGGKVLPGLVKRRATERAICEGRLA
jgi:lysozyme